MAVCSGNFAKYDYSNLLANGVVGQRHAHSVAQEFYLNLTMTCAATGSPV